MILPLLLIAQCCCPCDAGAPDASPPPPVDAGVPDSGAPPIYGSPGCGKAAQTGVYGNTNFQAPSAVGATTYIRRSYTISVPLSYNPSTPYPLIVAFHGMQWQGSSLRLSTPNVESVSTVPAIHVYPDGLSYTWDLSAGSKDVALFDALTAHLKETLCVNPAKVFLWGRSMGGGMGHVIAAQRKAVLSRFGLLVPYAGNAIAPAGPLPAYLEGNYNDTTVGTGYLTLRDRWAPIDGCTPATPPNPAGVGVVNCLALACTTSPIQVCVGNSGHTPSPSAPARMATFFGLIQ